MKDNSYKAPQAAAAGPTTAKAKLSWKGMRIGTTNPIRLVERHFRFILFLTAVGLVYIWNAHTAERQAIAAEQLQQEIKELKSEYTTLNAKLSRSRTQSEILSFADTLGLRLLEEPPYKLSVAK